MVTDRGRSERTCRNVRKKRRAAIIGGVMLVAREYWRSTKACNGAMPTLAKDVVQQKNSLPRRVDAVPEDKDARRMQSSIRALIFATRLAVTRTKITPAQN